MKIVRNSLLLVIAVWYFISCTSDQCVLDTETFLNLEINVIDTNLLNAGYLDSLSVYSPEWSDSIHSANKGASGSMFFSLSPVSDTTTIIITSQHEPEKDTIRFYHQKEMVLLSPECGFIFTFSIDSFYNTQNLIDSVKLVNNELIIDEEGYFQIYL